jgi:hypothetical protein
MWLQILSKFRPTLSEINAFECTSRILPPVMELHADGILKVRETLSNGWNSQLEWSGMFRFITSVRTERLG